MKYPHRLWAGLVALDQLLGALVTGWPDVTLSAWAYMWDITKIRSWPRRLIDGIFFLQANHCLDAYLMELEQKQMPEEFRHEHY